MDRHFLKIVDLEPTPNAPLTVEPKGPHRGGRSRMEPAGRWSPWAGEEKKKPRPAFTANRGFRLKKVLGASR